MPDPPPPPALGVDDPLTRTDVEKLLRAGVSDTVTIAKARASGAERMNADDIIALKQAGASDGLIKQLIAYGRVAPWQPVSAPSTTRAKQDSWYKARTRGNSTHSPYWQARSKAGLPFGW